MGKDNFTRTNPSYKHLVDITLGRTIRVNKETRLADVSLEEYKEMTRRADMMRKLNNWCVDSDLMKRELKI